MAGPFLQYNFATSHLRSADQAAFIASARGLKPAQDLMVIRLFSNPRQHRAMIKATILRTALASLSFLAVWSILHSTASMATPLDSWEHHCTIDEGTKEAVCTTEIRSHDKKTEAIFYFARGPRGPVPFVAHSEEQSFGALTVKVDDEDVLEADNCVDGICYFEESKSRLLLRQFRGGRTAHVTIKDRQGRELFDAPITLMGFSAAYKLY
jgi:invasion protein IalB